MARAERVIGSGPRAGERFAVTVPTHVAALYEFTGGATASGLFSFDTRQGRTPFELSSSEVTLAVPDPNPFAADLPLVSESGTQPFASSASAAARVQGVGGHGRDHPADP